MKKHSLFTPSKKSSRSMRKSRGKLAFGLAAVASLSLGAVSSYAATWTLSPTAGSTTTWSGTTGWTPATAPTSASDTTLSFGGSYSAAGTVTSRDDVGSVGTPFLLNVLTLGASNSGNYTTVTYNIQPANSATNTLAFVANGATAPVVNLNANTGSYSNAVNYNVSLNATIAGALTFQGAGSGGFNFSGSFSDGASAGSIVKTGASALSLSGSNSFTGGLTLSQGTLNINNASALGTGNLTIAAGTVINNTSAAAITNINNNTQTWNGSFTFGGTKALNLGTGAVALGSNVTTTVNGNATTALTVGGDISGSGKSLTKAGNGTLILSGNNSYDGGTTINAGVLQFNNSNSIGGSGANVTVNYGGVAAFGYSLDQATLAGRIAANSKGTVALAANSSNDLDFSAAALTKVSLGATSGTSVYSGGLWTPADGVYRLGGGGGTLIFNPGLTGANSLVVGGGGSGGTVTLAAAGNYSGGTTVTGATGSVSLGSLTGASLLQTNVLAGSSTTPFGSGTITLNNGGLGLGTAGALSAGDVINVVGNDLVFSGQNTVNLAVGGGSSVTLAANTLTRVNNGVLVLNPTSGATLGNTEKVTVASGAPTVTNGMVSPYYVNGTTKNFLTYGANGFQDVTYTKTASNALPTGLVSTDNVLINETGNNTTIASFGNLAVNSLKIANSNGSNGTQTLGVSTDTLSILSGGLILNWTAGSGNTYNGATINFGTNEGVVGVFGVSGVQTVNSRIIGTGGFTTYGNQTLTVGNLQTTGGVNVAGGSTLLVPGNAVITINPNNILTVDKGGVFGSNANNRPAQFLGLAGEGAITWNSSVGGGNVGANTYTVDGLTQTGTTTFSGIIQDGGYNSNYTLSISKYGLSTQVLTGANNYAGTTGVNSGTLRLDFSAAGAPANNIINNVSNGSALSLGGGRLEILGAAGATNTQQFRTLSVGGGNSEIKLTAGTGGGTPTVTTGTAFSRSTGATLNIVDATGGSVSSTAALTSTNGVWIQASATPTAFATVNGTDWATVTGGTISALSSYSTGNANYTSSNNVDVTDGDSVSGVTVNTLRFNSATSGLTLAGANVVNTGGILVTAASTAASITGGTLKPSSGNELVIVNNGKLTVNSALANGSAATALTFSGTGTTVLNSNNSGLTGNAYINSGTVEVGNGGALGATSGTLCLNGGALQSSSAITLNAKPVLLVNNSTISGTNDLTISGAFTNNRNYNTLTVNNTGLTTLSGGVNLGAGYVFNVGGSGNITASGVLSSTGGLNYAGSGTMTLSNAANTYGGVTRVSGGTLSVSTIANGGVASSTGTSSSANTNIVLNGGALQYTGAAASSDRLFSVGGAGGTLDASGSGALNLTNTGAIGFDYTPGDRTLTLAGSNTDNNTLAALVVDYLGLYRTSVTKAGAGTWVISGANTYTGATTIKSGTLSLGATGSINNSTAITVKSGATLDLSGLSGASIGSAQTLQGAGTVNGPSAGALVVSGTLAPGENSIDTLTVNGSLTLAGTTVMDISKSGFVLSSDLLTGSTTLQLGGVLIVNWTGDALASGDIFTLFSSSNITGSFDTANLLLPTLGSGLDWDTSKLNLNGEIQVVPEPATWAMMVGGFGMLAFCNRLRRQRRA